MVVCSFESSGFHSGVEGTWEHFRLEEFVVCVPRMVVVGEEKNGKGKCKEKNKTVVS